MAAFRIGQRVRIVRVEIDFWALGKEATVACHESNGKLGILVDGFRSPHPSGECTVWPDQIEPIQYDGNQLVSWSECLWQPEGQAA